MPSSRPAAGMPPPTRCPRRASRANGAGLPFGRGTVAARFSPVPEPSSLRTDEVAEDDYDEPMPADDDPEAVFAGEGAEAAAQQ